MKSHGIIWNHMEPHETTWNHMKPHNHAWNFTPFHTISRQFTRNKKRHFTPVHAWTVTLGPFRSISHQPSWNRTDPAPSWNHVRGVETSSKHSSIKKRFKTRSTSLLFQNGWQTVISGFLNKPLLGRCVQNNCSIWFKTLQITIYLNTQRYLTWTTQHNPILFWVILCAQDNLAAMLDSAMD